MRPVDVLIFVEHVARELDVACVLKHHLRTRFGLHVEVASLALDLPTTLRAWTPRVIAFPYFYSRHDLGVREALLRWPGARAVNLAFEQLFSRGNQQFKVPRDTIARRNVLHLAAGEFYREFLFDHGVDRQNAVVVGSLPCALYRKPYHELYAGQRGKLAAEHGLNEDRPWIFFPENYAAAFFSDREVDRRVRMGCQRSDVVAYRNASRSSLRQVMQWIREAVAQGTQVILRPRPATPREALVAAYEEYAGPLPRDGLRIVKDSTVRQWILASDVTASSFSTVLVEAAVAAKPAMLVVPEPLPDAMYSPWHDLAPRVTTQDEFLSLASCSFEDRIHRPLRHWAELQLLAKGDPLSLAAECIAKVASGELHLDAVPSAPLWEHVQHAWKAQWKTLRMRWRRRKFAGPGNQYEMDAFTEADVQRITSDWSWMLAGQPPFPHANRRVA